MKMWQESVPLLHTQNSNNNKIIKNDNKRIKTFYHDDVPDDQEELQSQQMFEEYLGAQRHGTDILISDMCVMLLEILQLLALIQSLSLRWIWPQDYLSATNFIFLFNLDVWSFDKINSGAFRHVQAYYTPSSEMSFSYSYLLIGWGIVCTVLIICYIVIYIFISYIRHSYMFLQHAWLQRIAIITIQILALPVGTAFMRTFHITSDSKVDINNEINAFSGLHLAIIIPLAIFIVIVFIPFPLWLIQKTSKQIVGKTTDRHEGYLQLKEMEKSVNLDMIWTIHGFHIFASYKLHLRHYRAYFHIFKFIFLIFYAALYNHMLAQTITLAVLLSLALFIVLLLTPYRVTCYNIVLALSLALLSSDVIFSAVMATFNPSTVQSSWLVAPHSVWILSILNGCLVIVWFIFIVYVLVRQFCLKSLRRRLPLWPSMSNGGILCLTPQTRTYVCAILHGRQLLERSLAIPAILAPAHELAIEIERINAYCRESEWTRDGIHDSLWDLLHELIEAHAYITPKSLFAASVKRSVKQTAHEFVLLVPMLVHRLHQREFDFVLVSPTRKRILFKLFVLATFLNAKSDRLAKKAAEREALKSMWFPTPTAIQYNDETFNNLLYPLRQSGPLCRPRMTSLNEDLPDPVLVNQDDNVMIDLYKTWMMELDYLPQVITVSHLEKLPETESQRTVSRSTVISQNKNEINDLENTIDLDHTDKQNDDVYFNDTITTEVENNQGSREVAIVNEQSEHSVVLIDVEPEDSRDSVA